MTTEEYRQQASSLIGTQAVQIFELNLSVQDLVKTIKELEAKIKELQESKQVSEV